MPPASIQLSDGCSAGAGITEVQPIMPSPCVTKACTEGLLSTLVCGTQSSVRMLFPSCREALVTFSACTAL